MSDFEVKTKAFKRVTVFLYVFSSLFFVVGLWLIVAMGVAQIGLVMLVCGWVLFGTSAILSYISLVMIKLDDLSRKIDEIKK